jgi:ppGpp synthetase/RelA/SpoT-type nucleotidyltranferase
VEPSPSLNAAEFPKGTSINLDSWDAFFRHPWVSTVRTNYQRDALRASFARTQILRDLKHINTSSAGRTFFVTVEARVKTEESFFRKLFAECKLRAKREGMSPLIIQSVYEGITDLCGVRCSCPYFDDIAPSIIKVLRPGLSARGYATDLQNEPALKDKDYLEQGNEFGYRSYHFFVRVPTVVDIYGATEFALCEFQVRSELQHVWVVKSHDLLYKPLDGWVMSDRHVVEDMRQISSNLRAADQHLISIRDRIRAPEKGHG